MRQCDSQWFVVYAHYCCMRVLQCRIAQCHLKQVSWFEYQKVYTAVTVPDSERRLPCRSDGIGETECWTPSVIIRPCCKSSVSQHRARSHQVVASWRHLPVGDMSRCGKMFRGGEKFVSKWKIVSKLLNRLFEVSRSGKKFDFTLDFYESCKTLSGHFFGSKL